MKYGNNTEYGKIESILLKKPAEAFGDQTNISQQWKNLNYLGEPDFKESISEYENLVEILTENISEVMFLPKDETTSLDSLYVRDTSLVLEAGAIITNLGKDARIPENAAVKAHFESINIPIMGEITGEGRLEGGDVIVLNSKTMVVGIGYRTNQAGADQLRDIVKDIKMEVLAIDLPHWEGPEDVFHLMSFISPLDKDLAVTYSRPMPVRFRNWLLDKGLKLIDIEESEYSSLACNILAIAPSKCLMVEGNPKTQNKLEKAGVEVITFKGEEICLKGSGGPTCLTRPVYRDD